MAVCGMFVSEGYRARHIIDWKVFHLRSQGNIGSSSSTGPNIYDMCKGGATIMPQYSFNLHKFFFFKSILHWCVLPLECYNMFSVLIRDNELQILGNNARDGNLDHIRSQFGFHKLS